MAKNVFEIMNENGSMQKLETFNAKQKEPYEFKRRYAEIRAWEFYNHPEVNGMAYVAVGGLDSITLYVFLRSLGIDVPAVSVSNLEDPSIQRVHKALGVECLKSSTKPDGKRYTMTDVVREFGYPVLSKEKAAKIELLQNPSEKNKTVRHAIITGETGAYGGFQKNSRMKMPQKWLEKFGGRMKKAQHSDTLQHHSRFPLNAATTSKKNPVMTTPKKANVFHTWV